MAADDVEGPTEEWPSPAEEDTDPVGFAPIYAPPADPFVDDDEFPSTGNGFDSVFPHQLWSAPAEPPRRRRRLLVAVVATVVVLGGMTVAILNASRNSPPETRNEQVNGRTSAAFDLVDGAASVKISAGDLGGDLYRILTPAGSGVTPRVENGPDGVRLHLTPTGQGPTRVEIVLNTAVRWTLRLDGGTQNTDVNLSGAQVDAVDLSGGASRIDLTMPVPRGLVPVRMTGGVDQFQVRLAGGTPVRVQVQSGAGQVTLDGSTYHGIAPGRSFTAYGWGSGGTGVDLFAVAGMAALTVTAAH